jgi:mono/diheme cytochrome c family protein
MITRSPTRIAALLLCGAGFAIALAHAALAQSPDAAQGRALVKRWCAGCHQVEAGQPASDAAPSLLAVAKDAKVTPERLRSWLLTPHPAMPDFNLSQGEIDAIIAHLDTLRGQ